MTVFSLSLSASLAVLSLFLFSLPLSLSLTFFENQRRPFSVLRHQCNRIGLLMTETSHSHSSLPLSLLLSFSLENRKEWRRKSEEKRERERMKDWIVMEINQGTLPEWDWWMRMKFWFRTCEGREGENNRQWREREKTNKKGREKRSE